MHINNKYDVVVAGAGIAGATTALTLAQVGLKVLVVEAAKHPRFAIGESIVPTTTAQFYLVSDRWKIPELRDLTRYGLSPKATAAGADFPKSAFWFGLHEEDQNLDLSHELLMETFDPPIGPDAHINREKFDEYLVSLFPKYKVDYIDQTVIDEFSRDADKMCHLILKSRDESLSHNLSCRFIIDATGHSAFFSKKLGHFQAEVNLKNNTRGIYGHFKLSSIPKLDDVLGGPCLLFRHKREASTMHHCFHGGWIWVIPFDDDTVSVGIVLNRDVYPEQNNIAAKDEFYSIINKFPTIQAHLATLQPVRPFTRKPRLQIMSNSIIGDGIIITPHAAAFIDALFSTGILMTITFVRNLSPILQKAFKTKNFGMEQFKEMEEIFFRDINQVDTIVSGMIESFRHIEVFKQYWRIWVCASMYQATYNIFLRDHVINKRLCGLYGSNNDVFRNDVAKMWEILMNGRNRNQLMVAAELKEIIDKHWLFCKGHPYEYDMGRIGSRFPFKIVAKITLPNFIKHVMKYEMKHISIIKILIRIYSRILIYNFIGKFRELFKLQRYDKRRQNAVISQRLPWYESDLLK